MTNFDCESIKNSPTNKLLCCGKAECKLNNNLDLTACDKGEYRGFDMILAKCHKISDIKDCEHRKDGKAANICGRYKDDPSKVYCLTMDLTIPSNQVNGILFSSDRPPGLGVTEEDRIKARRARDWTFNRQEQGESLDNAAACCNLDNCNGCDKTSLSSVYCDDMFEKDSTCAFKHPNGSEVTRFYYNTICNIPIDKKSSL